MSCPACLLDDKAGQIEGQRWTGWRPTRVWWEHQKDAFDWGPGRFDSDGRLFGAPRGYNARLTRLEIDDIGLVGVAASTWGTLAAAKLARFP